MYGGFALLDHSLLNRVCPSEGYTSRPLLVTSLMASLFYLFFRKYCIRCNESEIHQEAQTNQDKGIILSTRTAISSEQ